MLHQFDYKRSKCIGNAWQISSLRHVQKKVMASSPGRLFNLFAAAVVAFLANSQAKAQQTMGAYKDVTTMPDGYKGERIAELLDVINGRNPERIKQFVQERFTNEFLGIATLDEHVEQFTTVYEINRGLEFHSVRVYEGERPRDEVVVIAHSKLVGNWRGLVMSIEPEPPHRISSLMFAPARPPSDLPPQKKLSSAEIAPTLKAFVDKLARC